MGVSQDVPRGPRCAATLRRKPPVWQATGETYRSATDFLVALNAAFAGKQRVQNLVIPSLLPTAIGAPWGPGFSEIELNTKFSGNCQNSHYGGGFTRIVHSLLCRRPAHWWGRSCEVDRRREA